MYFYSNIFTDMKGIQREGEEIEYSRKRSRNVISEVKWSEVKGFWSEGKSSLYTEEFRRVLNEVKWIHFEVLRKPSISRKRSRKVISEVKWSDVEWIELKWSEVKGLWSEGKSNIYREEVRRVLSEVKWSEVKGFWSEGKSHIYRKEVRRVLSEVKRF